MNRQCSLVTNIHGHIFRRCYLLISGRRGTNLVGSEPQGVCQYDGYVGITPFSVGKFQYFLTSQTEDIIENLDSLYIYFCHLDVIM